MKFKANIDIMPHDALLGPRGKAVTQSMGNLGLNEISNVRIGKHVTLFVDADSLDLASAKVTDACTKLLCNQIMENFSFELEEVS